VALATTTCSAAQ
jgi:RTX calcium-binding nonapeptide repeat (4 copies)